MMKVIPPEGYEVDKINSTFECIKFKPKKLSYEDIAEKLFKQGNYFIGNTGEIHFIDGRYYDLNSSTSKKQCEKLIAINKLMNVAKYLNGNWKPDWDSTEEEKYYPYLNSDNVTCTGNTIFNNSFIVYFKKPVYIKQAIDILGEDTIRLALSTNW